MDDRQRKALDAALASIKNFEPEPITPEEIEDSRNRIDSDMLQHGEDFAIPFFRPAILDLYMRWTQGELETDPPPAMHKAVGQFLTELFKTDKPRELTTATKKQLDEHRNPEKARIIRCMKYCMQDAELPFTQAVEKTMELLGIDSYDQVKQIWQRSPESRPFKRR